LGYAGVSSKQGKITKNDIQDPNYSRHVTLGFNYRMSEVNAAVLYGQLERAEELVAQRIKVSKIFDQVINKQDLLIKQFEPQGYKNTYWAYSVYLNTKTPSTDWYRFRDLFQSLGGDGFYAAWKLSYNEPLFQNEIQKQPGVWQRYDKNLCPNAEFLQPRIVQFKTNYWDINDAERQAEILEETINKY